MSWMHHSWFNLSPFEGDFGCFHFLAATKSNINSVYTFLDDHKFSLPWDKHPRIQLLECMVNVYLGFFFFLLPSSSRVPFPLHTPNSNAREIQFLCIHPSQLLVLPLFFYFSDSDRYAVIPQCGPNLHFPDG